MAHRLLRRIRSYRVVRKGRYNSGRDAGKRPLSRNVGYGHLGKRNMKGAYPVIFSPAKEGGYDVYIPDWEINTQGNDLPEAIYMARDAISVQNL